MRNRYPGTCYRCGQFVLAGAGHFERHNGGWRTQHAECAIKFRHLSTEEQAALSAALRRSANVIEQK